MCPQGSLGPSAGVTHAGVFLPHHAPGFLRGLQISLAAPRAPPSRCQADPESRGGKDRLNTVAWEDALEDDVPGDWRRRQLQTSRRHRSSPCMCSEGCAAAEEPGGNRGDDSVTQFQNRVAPSTHPGVGASASVSCMSNSTHVLSMRSGMGLCPLAKCCSWKEVRDLASNWYDPTSWATSKVTLTLWASLITQL